MVDVKTGLVEIFGKENVLDAPETLEAYAKDESFVHPLKPRFVVRPKNTEEVQELVRWAKQTRTPLVPVSSGAPHFRGDTVPSAPGAVIVDLSGMNKIIKINRRNRLAIIEPGVTYSQLQPELAKEGLCLSTTLIPRANKSVLASLLEKEPRLIPRFQWAILDPLRCIEVVWGDGQKLVTGNAENASIEAVEANLKRGQAQFIATGPGQTDFYRLVSAAQGSMGIVTWATVKCEVLPQIHKTFFVTSEKLKDLHDFTYKILRFRFGDELMILNNFSLACVLGNSPDEIRELREDLPTWIAIVGVAGRDRLAKERVEFQEQDISDIARSFGLQLKNEIPGTRSSEVLRAINNTSREPYWKLGYKGGCQEIFFVTTLEKTSEFVRSMYSVAEGQGYNPSDIGVYIQPIHQGASCHCEFILPFDREDQREMAKMQVLFEKASEELHRQGAFFSRPYGMWADLAFNRDVQTTNTLKKIKGIFDPNNIMNTGKLCF
ncbi:MAG: FAD-binding oxidoreductase [Thermincola sp.]|jgi:FAD/FMN-containing dehydrogenase|nr:FAD-binding oxidoreductase [Thermincola sp.]MDT3704173.1 FAD-binding oxidoreductase [Thermincola sp.]